MSFSTTKGVVATALHVLADRGLLDYDDPVAKHWPEFAQTGKERVTVRDVLSHRAGLPQIRPLVDRADRILDWEYMVRALERAKPRLEPGGDPAYHAFTFGWLAGEIVQRVTGRPARRRDPQPRSPSRSASTTSTSGPATRRCGRGWRASAPWRPNAIISGLLSSRRLGAALARRLPAACGSPSTRC